MISPCPCQIKSAFASNVFLYYYNHNKGRYGIVNAEECQMPAKRRKGVLRLVFSETAVYNNPIIVKLLTIPSELFFSI
jgi:hypothetical protein